METQKLKFKSQKCNSKVKSYFLILTFIFAFCLLTFSVAFAAVPLPTDLRPPGAPTLDEETPEKQADVFTARVVNFILGFAGIVAIFFIVNNAWFLIASGGSEETITQHKKGLMWAVVGLILIILSYSIISFIIEIPFKADQPRPDPGAAGGAGGGTAAAGEVNRAAKSASDTGSPFGGDAAA